MSDAGQNQAVRVRHRRRRADWFRAIESLEFRRLLNAHIVGGSGANNYTLIQDAVDNCPANGTVLVDAGTYTEQVFLYNGITLKGAQAGVDARSNERLPSAGASETILQGPLNPDSTRACALKVVGNSCTVDGFVIANTSSTSSVTGAGITINPTISGTHIVNCIVQNNVTGMYLANNSASAQCVIQHNVFLNNNNNAAAGVNPGRAIYTDGSLTNSLLTNVLIDGNFFSQNWGTNDFAVEAAIGLEGGTASTQSNIQISNNVFDNNGKAVLALNATNVTISGNVVNNHLDTGSAALRFEGGDTNITITGNNLYADDSPAISIDQKGSTGANSGFTITGNNIYHNGLSNGDTGLDVTPNQYTGTITATNNWWGSSDGPGGDVFNGSGDNILNGGNVAGSPPITFQPFATSPVVERQVPWYGLASVTGAPIQSEDFDHGLEGVSYHDTTTSFGGYGGPYRPNQDVDMTTTTDGGNGYVVTPVAGEWIEYTVNIPSAGTYQLDARLQFSSNGGQFHLTKADGTTTIPGSNVTLSGASANFQTITQGGLTFDTAGVQIVRVMFDSGTLGQWNWFRLTQTASGAPTAPSNLQAAIVNSGQVNLTWQDNSSNEANFILERSTDNQTWNPLATPPANSQAYSDSNNLVVGTTYYYRIRATLNGNDSANATTSVSLTTPTAPTGLAASPASSSQINLTWTDTSNNETNFILERSPNNSTWTQIATPAANAQSYNDNVGLSPKTHYYYRIRATNVVGPSANSAVAAGTTLASNGLPSPFIDSDIGSPGATGSATFAAGGTFTIKGAGNIGSTADSGNFMYVPVTGDATIIARFTAFSGGNTDSYAGLMFRDTLAAGAIQVSEVINPTTSGNVGFLRRTALNGSTTASGGTSLVPSYLKLARVGNVFTATAGTDGVNFPTSIGSATIAMGSSYFIGLVAASGINGNLVTGTVTNLTITSTPNAPSALGASAISASEIDLNWTDNAFNETGTKIERSPNGTTGWTQIGIADPDMTTYQDLTVAGGTQYFYRVRATNSTADSAYSANANTTTPPGWATMSGSTLNLVFDGTSTPLALGMSGANVTVTKSSTTLTFSGVVSIAAAGTANADALQIAGAITQPLTFTNGNGADSVRIMSGGSYTFANDLSPSLKNISLQIDSGGSATINSTQHLSNLTVAGSATVAAGGNTVLVVQGLSVTGQLDLKDNDLILDYSTTSPVGTWNGSLYDGVTGMVAAGRNGGQWNGNGICSSSAVGSYTGLGVAEASQVLGANGGMFDGESVDGSAVLVKFTYVGDVNLDGKINIDDYTKMDNGIAIGSQNWINGDLNYDGKINIDDYTLIDTNIGTQGAIL